MTTTWHFFDKASGVLSGASYTGDDEGLAKQLAHKGDQIGAIDGVADYLSQRVDVVTGLLIDYQPPAPSDTDLETFAWDATTRRYIATPTAAAIAADVRARRNALLAACDWTQVPDSPLDDAAKAAWRAYRASLRGVPEQVAFPGNVDWPAPPG